MKDLLFEKAAAMLKRQWQAEEVLRQAEEVLKAGEYYQDPVEKDKSIGEAIELLWQAKDLLQ